MLYPNKNFTHAPDPKTCDPSHTTRGFISLHGSRNILSFLRHVRVLWAMSYGGISHRCKPNKITSYHITSPNFCLQLALRGGDDVVVHSQHPYAFVYATPAELTAHKHAKPAAAGAAEDAAGEAAEEGDAA